MSRTRIVGGTITKTTRGDHNIYSDGNIVYNSGTTVTETSDEGIKYGEPKSSPPASKLHFVDGWWALDKEGKSKIKRALPGMTVYFHLKTKNIPNGNSVFLSLFDEDNHEKEEPQNKDGKKDKDDAIKLINSQTKKQVLLGKVIDNKIVQKINLSGLGFFIDQEVDKCLDLYFRCSYKIENAQYPASIKDYLKVGPVIIDRYKMPGLNSSGLAIADDMTYGTGTIHNGEVYTADVIKKFKKEYQLSGFDNHKHAVFSNHFTFAGEPLLEDTQVTNQDNKNYQAIQDNLRVVKLDAVKILNADIIAKNKEKNNKGRYSKEEILKLGYLMEFSNLTNFRLWFNFRTLKALLAWGNLSSILEEMIDKFQRSEGGVYENPILTKSIKENQNTIQYCTKIEDYLAEQLKTNFNKLEEVEDLEPYFADSNQDMRNTKGNRKDSGKEFSRPAYSYWDSENLAGNLFSGRTLALNDIWATEVILKELEFEGENYKGKYEVTLWDHFGLDKPDLEKFYYNINGFRAWFLLQHLQGYKPFLSKMTFIKDFKGNLKEGKKEIESKRKLEQERYDRLKNMGRKKPGEI
ncbi:DUF3289 family protein [Flavobacterium ginsengiterrae]|uniref:DUF3289 family protein n=1 Tax=Flavobacterium ginsengiterrae TaxID=871695 RepID=A0ABP7GKX4_9FLAO